MNIKLNILTSAILAGFSTVAFSQGVPVPPQAPDVYASGPASPRVNTTDLSLAERCAYANYEALFKIVEAVIYSKGEKAVEGSYNITAYADGTVGDGTSNFVTLDSNNSSITLSCVSSPESTKAQGDRGQQLTVQSSSGSFQKVAISSFNGSYAYNKANSILDGTVRVDIQENGHLDRYYGELIKDFYRGSVNSTDCEYFNIYDWGLQSLDKLGYPVNKYWQSSKSHRSDGTNGRTVFVVDRLVGATPVRITIDTWGTNNADYFDQTGKITISTDLPGVPAPQFTDGDPWCTVAPTPL